ncbi:MAG: hypothetical protein ACKO85_16925, partial [Isosphaeraceae bacterium]
PKQNPHAFVSIQPASLPTYSTNKIEITLNVSADLVHHASCSLFFINQGKHKAKGMSLGRR